MRLRAPPHPRALSRCHRSHFPTSSEIQNLKSPIPRLACPLSPRPHPPDISPRPTQRHPQTFPPSHFPTFSPSHLLTFPPSHLRSSSPVHPPHPRLAASPAPRTVILSDRQGRLRLNQLSQDKASIDKHFRKPISGILSGILSVLAITSRYHGTSSIRVEPGPSGPIAGSPYSPLARCPLPTFLVRFRHFCFAFAAGRPIVVS